MAAEKERKTNTKLTDKFIKGMCEKKAKYNFADSRMVVCFGVSRSAFQTWKRQGNELIEKINAGEVKENDLTAHEKKCIKLIESLDDAQIQFEEKLLQNIRDAGEIPKHWQANAWILERTQHEHYARKEPREYINGSQEAAQNKGVEAFKNVLSQFMGEDKETPDDDTK